MIISSSVLEHLRGQEAFFANGAKALKPGGYFIHVFPSKFALFAVINQLLPKRWARKLLFFVFPERKSFGGFPAYYDHCYHAAMKKLLTQNGFRVEEIVCSYFQSSYFGAFFPAYLISLAWDNLCGLLKLKNLCAYLCVVARKEG